MWSEVEEERRIMGIIKDLTGKRFGRLTVIEQAGRGKYRHVLWKCVCDCGKETYVTSNQLVTGRTKSCGCLHEEFIGNISRKHSGSNDRLYNIWEAMKKRCNNQHCPDYKNYGAVGVTVCDEWYDYGTFRTWALANGYDPNAEFSKCTIDRINPFGNYEPSNCRWVDMKVQRNNQRSHYLERENERRKMCDM